MEIEELTSNEVVTSLWSKHATEKCRIGLADTLIYENDSPERWYVTGKTGEVTKKRAIDLSSVSQRWLKIREQYDSPMVAIIRQEGGIYKFLNVEAWNNFISEKKVDSSVHSLHCFINGENHTVFRNKYVLKDKQGRINSSTYTYSFNLPRNLTEAVVTMYESKLKLIESRASQIKNILDLATTTVVRYVETMLSIKILHMEIDYVVDKNSQIWMMWTLNTQFARTTKLEELPLPIPNVDRDGRIQWMGRKYLEELEESKLRNDNNDPSTSHHRTRAALSPTSSFRSSSPINNSTRTLSPPQSPSSFRNNHNSSNGNTDIANSNSHNGKSVVNTFGAELISQKAGMYSSYPKPDDRKLPAHIAASQVNSAANVTVMDAVAPKSASNRKRVNENHSASYQLNPQSVDVHVLTGSFPNAFKCKGDYCNFQIDPRHATTDPKTDIHFANKLFTEQEIIKLCKDKNFNKMMEFESAGPALAAMTMRSIVLARQERRGLNNADNSQPWNKYPDSPHDKIKFLPVSAQDAHLAENKRNQDEIETILTHDKDQRESFTKSMSTYYDQIRVCGVCFSIYTCLDWARDTLGRGDAYGAGMEGLGAAHSKIKDNHTRSPLREGHLLEDSTVLENNLEMAKTISTVPSYASATTASVASQKPKKEIPLATINNPSSPKSRGASLRPRNHIARDGNGGSSWKSHLTKEREEKRVEGNKFVALDDYLRGGNEQIVERKEREKDKLLKMRVNNLNGELSFSSSSSIGTGPKVYHGKVLLACENNQHAEEAKNILEEALFEVYCTHDGRKAVNDYILLKDGYDCILVQRDLPLLDGFAVTKEIRRDEATKRREAAAYAASQGRGVQPHTKRHPVICYTSQTSPEDLKAYMHADMDGCVSFPVNKISLLNTIRAAIPQHLAKLEPPEPTEQEIIAAIAEQQNQPKVYRLGNLGELENSNDSSSMAVKSLPLGQSTEDDVALNGVVQIDADTRVPFMVMDASRTAKILVNPNKPFFNLVVIHDLFDTAEKMKIFLRPMVQRYLGMQVLLWNYPGQAFTEWREEQLLNNEYLATCLNEVLGQVGEKGTKDFDTSRPFYIMGFGNGASIASFYASHYRVPNLRGILNVNGWSFVDSYLAGIMHDCINIFQCAPPTRPDLPIYFFSRFIFCKDYLSKVSVPLALNIYTAVHNSISIKGRLSLCKGVLQSVDVRSLLREIDCPMICIHSTQDAFARPLHTEPFITKRAGEVRSIHKVLKEPHKTCVVWMKGGHEVFQENKKQLQLLIEQILTGFHENHDVSYPTASVVDATSAAQGKLISSLPWENEKNAEKTVEDKFIDSVLNSVNRMNDNRSSGSPARSAQSSYNYGSQATPNKATSNDISPSRLSSSQSLTSIDQHHRHRSSQSQSASHNIRSSTRGSVQFSATDPNAWNEYSQLLSESQVLSKGDGSNSAYGHRQGKNKSKADDVMKRIIDPNSSLFERQDNIVYGTRAMELKKQQQDVHDYPEVKEYMGWRLKRNKKRLQRLQAAARTIQGAFRAFMARRLVYGIRRVKAAIIIQRVFRGWLGRCTFKNRVRGIWASQIIQRAWRGFVARKWYFYFRLRIAAAANIQRMYRGLHARKRVKAIKLRRYQAASIMQAMYRRYASRKLVWRMRQFRNCATTIQRIFRGHLGRKKSLAERDKYIFSRSQSHGIEFGRQMLLEHKLHATRLQSDVTLLTQEKVASEEQIEALLEEISSFEEGVRILEKEMHQLSKIEAEAAAFMDEDSRFELREQKIKLDKEFGDMLSKIGSRKDMLDDLEKKLGSIDKTRQSKEEELRTLERKLVVLLEEQQNELNAIKRKQDIRGQMLAASHSELMNATAPGSGNNNSNQGGHSGGGGGGGYGGPSLQEKKQAAQLMQSTETLMKFGFMSMSMTYFSSLNMVKALRTVSAQDTVMAALSDVHSQRAVGHGSSTGGDSMKKTSFEPEPRKGQLSGQQLLRVSAWSVEDVGKWLQTLSLGQYSEAFIDSAVDGEFLYDLNDDDLKNTLGIEHRLHRKKILNCVHRLKIAEAQKDSKLNELLRDSGGLEPPVLAPDEDEGININVNPFQSNGPGDAGNTGEDPNIDGPKISIEELLSLVRHSKLSQIKAALDYLPNKKFDKALIQVPFVPDFGTVYVSGYERLPFHCNKVDEFGNSMLGLACQNGNMKLCKYLISKGANANHQNKNGQTPAHFAVAYKFFEVSTYLFENGGDDTIENRHGLTPYDGLDADGGDGGEIALIGN